MAEKNQIIHEEITRETIRFLFGVLGTVATLALMRRTGDDSWREAKMQIYLWVMGVSAQQQRFWDRVGTKTYALYRNEAPL